MVRGGVKDKRAEIDPAELMRRKFRAKCLFRALGRLVMANAYWLIEDIDHYEGVEDVRRRVEQAVRGKAKQKQLLKVKDKALLNKPALERTDHEKKYIYRIIGGLKCFKRYPNHVKKKLAGLTYFKYYGPNRVVVRQHQEAHALYFIVSGDITVSQVIFDELIQEDVSVDIGSLHTGDMFGEVSLLHNIPRTATCTTVGHCEFLQLLKEDFKHVLLSSVQKQWDEVRRAMSYFTYFESLDDVAIREGCIVAKLKNYERNDTLLGDGCGILNHVYFILSGQVQVIESMQVITTERLGRKYYTLYDPYVAKEESEQDFDTKWFSKYPDLNKSSLSSDAQPQDSVVVPGRATNAKSRSVNSILKEPSNARHSVDGVPKPSDLKKLSKIEETKRTSFSGSSGLKKQSLEISGSKKLNASVSKRQIEGTASSKLRSQLRVPQGNVEEQQLKKQSNLSQTTTTTMVGSKVILPPLEGDFRTSFRISETQQPAKTPGNLKTYFMQVCRINPGGTFGFGENMRDRRYVALTPVSCMLMPKVWLLQRNTANIWTRIQYYLEKKIPKKNKLFVEFVHQRHWMDYRDQCVEDVVARTHTVNYTTIHDVPYSIRMEEMCDI